jgi:hypothetical protein
MHDLASDKTNGNRSTTGRLHTGGSGSSDVSQDSLPLPLWPGWISYKFIFNL